METTAIPIQEVDKTELRQRIPRGGIANIQRETGYHYNYVREVINGDANNLKILQKAYDLYWEYEKPALKVHANHASDLTQEAA